MVIQKMAELLKEKLKSSESDPFGRLVPERVEI